MPSYKFNINEGANTATLTVKASDEQTARQQAQQLLKSSDDLGEPQEVSDTEQSQTQ